MRKKWGVAREFNDSKERIAAEWAGQVLFELFVRRQNLGRSGVFVSACSGIIIFDSVCLPHDHGSFHHREDCGRVDGGFCGCYLEWESSVKTDFMERVESWRRGLSVDNEQMRAIVGLSSISDDVSSTLASFGHKYEMLIDTMESLSAKTDAVTRKIVDARKATKSLVREGIGNRVRYEVLARDNHACVLCGGKKLLEVDHIVPVSLGGKNDMSNLRTLCHKCNHGKGNRPLEAVQPAGQGVTQ